MKIIICPGPHLDLNQRSESSKSRSQHTAWTMRSRGQSDDQHVTKQIIRTIGCGCGKFVCVHQLSMSFGFHLISRINMEYFLNTIKKPRICNSDIMCFLEGNNQIFRYQYKTPINRNHQVHILFFFIFLIAHFKHKNYRYSPP